MSATTMIPPPVVLDTTAIAEEDAVTDGPTGAVPEERQSRGLRKRLSLSRATKGLKRMMRPSHSSVRPVLEYYDVCLRQEDIDNRVSP